MRALVTGASGFVGTHLCNALRERCFDVVSLGTDPVCDHRVDVRDSAGLMTALRDVRPRAVFHLAAVAFVPAADADPNLTDAVNRGGTCNVLEAASVIHARTLVVSSGAVYGRVADDELPVRESHALAPVGAYARSKAAAEGACVERADRQEIVRVRPFNQVGPGQSPQYVCSDFASQLAHCERVRGERSVAVGDLSAQRDFVDVRDAVNGYIRAWEGGVPGEVYNVCSGVPVAIARILEMLLEMSSVEVTVQPRAERLRSAEVKRYYGTSDKLTAATGWRPTRTLTQTLADVLADWRKRVASEDVRAFTPADRT